MDEITKQLLSYGVLGLAVMGLLWENRRLNGKLDAAAAAKDASAKEHHKEIVDMFERHSEKADNYDEHLRGVTDRANANSERTNAILENLVQRAKPKVRHADDER